MVEYDSIIPPGRTGTITPGVNISHSHPGAFKKSVRVFSDAANEKELVLTLQGEIMPIVGVSSRYVRIQGGEKNKVEVVLRSQKDDLKVSEVAFETQSRGQNSAPWQSQMPIYVSHEMKKKDKKADKDGYYSYTLSLWLKKAPDSRQSGELKITTNHPEMKEITIRAMIE